MVCVILLVFIVCWAPLQVLILFAQFSHNSLESGEVRSWKFTRLVNKQNSTSSILLPPQLPEWYDQVMFLVYSIAYTNSTLNPLLYGGLNQVWKTVVFSFYLVHYQVFWLVYPYRLISHRLTGKRWFASCSENVANDVHIAPVCQFMVPH